MYLYLHDTDSPKRFILTMNINLIIQSYIYVFIIMLILIKNERMNDFFLFNQWLHDIAIFTL